MATNQKHMPVQAKGKRPQFLTTPGLDKAVSIITALVGEVSVLHDELDTLRKVLIEKKIITKNTLKAYKIDQETRKEREEWRELFLGNIFRVIEQDVKSMEENTKKNISN